MDQPRAIIVAAIILGASIILSPIFWQKYKMHQCVSAQEQTGRGLEFLREATCMQYLK